MNRNLFKTLQGFIKFTVGLGLVSMTLHAILYLFGIDEPISEWFCGFSCGGFVMLLMSSYVLRLCWKFRAALIFTFGVTQCITLQRELDIFEGVLEEALIITIVIGVILIGLVGYEYIKPKTCGENVD